jgi:FKBP-type peptidyl-prolyl cis-trans isomerase SlyD
VKVANDHWVEFHYDLFDARGELVESTAEDGPVRYLHGHEEILPGLERALEGHSPGEELRVPLPAGEAYGDYDPEGLITVPRSELGTTEELTAGDWLSVRVEGDDGAEGADDDDEMELRIIEVHADEVILDANHPLAGQDVTFRVTLLSVEPR